MNHIDKNTSNNCIPQESTINTKDKNAPNIFLPQETTSINRNITHDNSESTSKKPKRPCLYCGVFNSQLPRHLKRKHQNEEAVAAALKLPKVEQSNAFAYIRKSGIYKYNVQSKIDDSNGSLIKERRQRTSSTLMCSGCKGFFDSKSIWKHKKRCVSDGHLHSVNFSSLSKEFKELDLPEDFKIQVVDAFRKDDVGTLCRNDKATLHMGKMLWAKSERKDKHTIMADMRLYANVIIEMRKFSQQDITGEDVVNREYFEFLNKAIVILTSK